MYLWQKCKWSMARNYLTSKRNKKVAQWPVWPNFCLLIEKRNQSGYPRHLVGTDKTAFVQVHLSVFNEKPWVHRSLMPTVRAVIRLHADTWDDPAHSQWNALHINLWAPSYYAFSGPDIGKQTCHHCCVVVFITSKVNTYGHPGTVNQPIQTFTRQA